MANMDLEMFKEVFKDKRSHVVLGKIKKISMVSDRSALKCLVSIFPDQREVVARMSFAMTGPNAGIIEFPSVDDLVLVAFADGENDYAFIIGRLSSKEDTFPVRAVDGHMVLRSKAGMQAWLTSDTKILLSKGDDVPTENLVLGQELKSFLVDTLAKIQELSLKVEELSTKVSTHDHIGNLGYPVSPPNQTADFVALAADFNGLGGDFDSLSQSPVQDETILSDLAFTEKGS